MLTPSQVSAQEWGLFNEAAPVLTNRTAVEAYDAWWADEEIDSAVVRVGLIEPTEEEVARIASIGEGDEPCTQITEDHPLAVALGSFVTKFRAAVAYDIQRGALEGMLHQHIEAGYYDRTLFPHVDESYGPTVKWMAALGVGSTIGFHGKMRMSSTVGVPFLRADMPMDKAASLEEVHQPEGAVLRILPAAGTVHSWPAGRGGRFYVQSTLYVDR